jgi:hypothetical protein
VNFRKPLQQCLEDDPRFETGQWRAQAVVNAAAKGEGAGVVSADV